MLQLGNSDGTVLAPVRVVCERHEADAYTIDESALAVIALLPEETQPAPSAPVQEREVVETMPYVPAAEPEARPMPQSLTQLKFRQALIEVDNPGEFWDGVVGGQIAAVEEQRPLTAALVFELFEDAVRDVEFSETWLSGYLLGLSDALLRQRKVYPREYTALLKPLNYHISRRRKSRA